VSSKWIAGQLWYKEDFRYVATALRRDATGFELYEQKPIVRRFEKRKDAEKWLKYERSHGALTKLDVRAAYYRPIF